MFLFVLLFWVRFYSQMVSFPPLHTKAVEISGLSEKALDLLLGLCLGVPSISRLFNLDCRYPRDQLQPARKKKTLCVGAGTLGTKGMRSHQNPHRTGWMPRESKSSRQPELGDKKQTSSPSETVLASTTRTVVDGAAYFLRAVDLRPGVQDIPYLVVSIRAPWLELPLSDFVNSMNTIYQGVLNGIFFRQMPIAAWFRAQCERIQLTVV